MKKTLKELNKAAKEYSKKELKRYKKEGADEVEVLPAADACDICTAWKGKKIPLKKALKRPPIPIKGCSNKKYGCRCCYVPVID